MNSSLENPRAPNHRKSSTLMTEVLHNENLKRALERVKRVEIPKPDGRTRLLCIPIVVS